MTDISSWFNENLQIRLEKLHYEMKKDDSIKLEQADFNILFHIFLKGLEKEERSKFLQLEVLWTRLEGLEKEWIYKKGIKDGVQLMLSML